MLQTIDGNIVLVDRHGAREIPAAIELGNGEAGIRVGSGAQRFANLPMLGALCFSILVFAALLYFRESLSSYALPSTGAVSDGRLDLATAWNTGESRHRHPRTPAQSPYRA